VILLWLLLPRIPTVPFGMDPVSRGWQATAGSMQKSFSWDRRPDNQSRISGSRKGEKKTKKKQNSLA